MRKLFFGAMLQLALISGAVADQDQKDPAKLVLDMSTAIRTLNYEGRFIHIRGNDIDAMSVIHSFSSKGEQERMLSLVGEAREIIRNDSLVTCIWPGSESVIVSKSKPRKVLSAFDESLVDNSMYDLTLGDNDRVAGRTAFVVNVKPTDSMRYGYRFWIDTDTHMLLRSSVLDTDGSTAEQLMFTSIDFPQSIDVSRFDIEQDSNSLIQMFDEKAAALKELPTPNKVSFEGLPSGYVKQSEAVRDMDVSDKPVSHVMVSDGMASVSVYVEYVVKAQQQTHTLGHSRMGAMNAFSHSLENAFVTVVGEVPKHTVEAIALAVRIAQ